MPAWGTTMNENRGRRGHLPPRVQGGPGRGEWSLQAVFSRLKPRLRGGGSLFFKGGRWMSVLETQVGLLEALCHEMTPKFLATRSADGIPNFTVLFSSPPASHRPW